MGKAQAWSMDLVIGVLIFMLATGILYAIINSRNKDDAAPLRIESEIVATKLTSDPSLKIAPNNQLDNAKLANLTGLDYETLKNQLGLKHEFCIYLEDENGNLSYIVDNNGKKYTGVGSGTGELNLSGTPCGCQVGNPNCKS